MGLPYRFEPSDVDDAPFEVYWRYRSPIRYGTDWWHVTWNDWWGVVQGYGDQIYLRVIDRRTGDLVFDNLPLPEAAYLATHDIPWQSCT